MSGSSAFLSSSRQVSSDGYTGRGFTGSLVRRVVSVSTPPYLMIGLGSHLKVNLLLSYGIRARNLSLVELFGTTNSHLRSTLARSWLKAAAVAFTLSPGNSITLMTEYHPVLPKLQNVSMLTVGDFHQGPTNHTHCFGVVMNGDNPILARDAQLCAFLRQQ